MSKHTVRKFWPLDYDPEGEIYENPSWDLPGFRPDRKGQTKPGQGRGSARSRR